MVRMRGGTCAQAGLQPRVQAAHGLQRRAMPGLNADRQPHPGQHRRCLLGWPSPVILWRLWLLLVLILYPLRSTLLKLLYLRPHGRAARARLRAGCRWEMGAGVLLWLSWVAIVVLLPVSRSFATAHRCVCLCILGFFQLGFLPFPLRRSLHRHYRGSTLLCTDQCGEIDTDLTQQQR
jgi:hypothetical protein